MLSESRAKFTQGSFGDNWSEYGWALSDKSYLSCSIQIIFVLAGVVFILCYLIMSLEPRFPV